MSALEPSVVAAAAGRLRGVVHRTPVVTCAAIDELAGRPVHLKCENLQRVGAFKFRGAYHAISRMPEERRARGVVAHSSGNHAQGVALAAALHGVRSVIVMPHDAPEVKRRATAGYGAEIVLCDAADRERVSAGLVDSEGLTLVHAYDDDDLIAGQGTAALELLDDVPEVRIVVTPLGGGGLSAGSALATALRGRDGVVVVEPETADDGRLSLERGEVVELSSVPDTVADGLRTRFVGRRNLAVLLRHGARAITVTDDEILAAMQLLWTRAKVLAEPSGAVALAGVLSSGFPVPPRVPVGVVVSGGNVDVQGFFDGLRGGPSK